jgi:uncharacterized protein (TIGR03067 family)
MSAQLLRVAAAILIAAASGCKPREPRHVDLLDSIQGEYVCVAMEAGGKRVPTDEVDRAGLKYAVRGNELIAFRPGGGEDPIRFTLDQATDPIQIDFTEQHPTRGERTTAGILKYEEGELTIVMSDLTGAEHRPRRFNSEGRQLMLVLKRDSR